MTKQLNILFLFIMILTMGLISCTGTTTSEIIDEVDGGSEELLPEAVMKARQRLSTELNVNEDNIVIIANKQVTWSDSCLGLGGIAESCMRTDLLGWHVEMLVEDTTYYAHTDKGGEQIRFEHKSY